MRRLHDSVKTLNFTKLYRMIALSVLDVHARCAYCQRIAGLAGWAMGLGTSLLLVLAYTLIAYGVR